MRDIQRSIALVIILLSFITIGFSITHTFTIKGGRTVADCDYPTAGRSLFMFGGSYEAWFTDYVSLGVYPYFSQLNGGPYNGGNPPLDPNFRTYIAGADLLVRLRPTWKYCNLYFDNKYVFVSRIAPYVNVGFGGITFDPERRNGVEINTTQNNYTKHTSTAPVIGGGFTFFSKLGVSGDLGVEYHKVNSDYLDGTPGGKDKDAFFTGYLALTISSSTPTAPPVRKVIEPILAPPPPPKPVPIIEPIPEPVPEPIPEPIIIPEPVPEPVPEPPPAPKPEIEFKKDVNLVIEGVVFKTGSAELTPGALVVLNKVVQTLKDFPEITLSIQGHTDSDGSEASNLSLSDRRAKSVRTYLISKGIASSRLTTIGYGESRPRVANDTPANKQINRRIEFIRTD